VSRIPRIHLYGKHGSTEKGRIENEEKASIL